MRRKLSRAFGLCKPLGFSQGQEARQQSASFRGADNRQKKMNEVDVSQDNSVTATIKRELIGHEAMPFVCGYCLQQFDRLSPYCVHIKGHNEAVDESFHICDKSDSNTTSGYTCTKCQIEFPSVCVLHSHLVNCLGSFIFDHVHCSAFPVEDLYRFALERKEGKYEKEGENTPARNIIEIIVESVTELLEADKIQNASKKVNVGTYAEAFEGSPNQCAIVSEENMAYNNDYNKIFSTENAFNDFDTSLEEAFMDTSETSLKTEFEKNLTSTAPEKDERKSNTAKKNAKAKLKASKYQSRNTKGKNERKKEKPKTDKKNSSAKIKVCKNQSRKTKEKELNVGDEISKDDNSLPPKDKRTRTRRAVSRKRSKLTENTLEDSTELSDTEVESEIESEVTREDDSADDSRNTEKITAKKKTKSKAKKPTKGPKEKSEHRCEVCGKVWAHLTKLRTHMVSHTAVRKFKCEICSNSYKYAVHLKEHMQIHNGSPLPVCCEVCGQGFVNLSTLKVHKLRKHSSEKNHVCTECGKSYKFLALLNRHKLGHNGEKPHVCEVCGQQFGRLDYLMGHVRSIHDNKRKFQCTEEGCSRRFLTNYQLQCHLKVHSGERPYKCVICQQGFIQRKELRRHLKKIHERNLEDMLAEDPALQIFSGKVPSPQSGSSTFPLLDNRRRGAAKIQHFKYSVIADVDLQTVENNMITSDGDIQTAEKHGISDVELQTAENNVISDVELQTAVNNAISDGDIQIAEMNVISDADMQTDENRVVSDDDLQIAEDKVISDEDV